MGSSDRFWQLANAGFSAPGAVGVFRSNPDMKNWMKLAMPLALAAFLSPGQQALSQSPDDSLPSKRRPAHPLFEVLDVDGDQVLSQEEIANATERIQSLDANGDQELTRREMMAPRDRSNLERFPRRVVEAERAGQGVVDARVLEVVGRLMESDSNGDGVITREELSPRIAESLFDADIDRDGRLDRNELIRYCEFEMLRRSGGAGKPQQSNDSQKTGDLSAQMKNEAKEQIQKDQIPAGPLKLRLLENLDTILIKGSKEDVAAISKAFADAIEKLKSVESDR